MAAPPCGATWIPVLLDTIVLLEMYEVVIADWFSSMPVANPVMTLFAIAGSARETARMPLAEAGSCEERGENLGIAILHQHPVRRYLGVVDVIARRRRHPARDVDKAMCGPPIKA